MTYTPEQKELLLNLIFDGVVCLDIYDGIDITHKNHFFSRYNFNEYEFWLNWYQIWSFFEGVIGDDYEKIKDLTSTILRDLTKQNKIKTFASHAIDFINQKELTN